MNRLHSSLAVLALGLAGCIASSVLEEDRRSVAEGSADDRATVEWRRAEAWDLQGLYESTSIEGERAQFLWKLYYHFESAGTYSGAALLLGEDGPTFETLSGTWKLEGPDLDLGDGAPAAACAATDRLRLVTADCTVHLRRVPLQ
ncbi:MAG: hypothetical protein IPK67_03555 [Planctomycetes bacterium]|nr:hypothetical protein [Planctomycetota bacterium]